MKQDHTLVYIPPDAKINIDGQPMDAPKVKYEKRKKRFNLEETKKVVGGRYGRNARHK